MISAPTSTVNPVNTIHCPSCGYSDVHITHIDTHPYKCCTALWPLPYALTGPAYAYTAEAWLHTPEMES